MTFFLDLSKNYPVEFIGALPHFGSYSVIYILIVLAYTFQNRGLSVVSNHLLTC